MTTSTNHGISSTLFRISAISFGVSGLSGMVTWMTFAGPMVVVNVVSGVVFASAFALSALAGLVAIIGVFLSGPTAPSQRRWRYVALAMVAVLAAAVLVLWHIGGLFKAGV